jgi:uncharacterized protein YrzB (UPF0473 family)
MENNELIHKINFTTEDGADVVFCVVEQTKLNGVDYLLVTEDAEDDEEVDAYILKDISNSEEEEAIYEMVEDDKELELIAKIFDELLEDTDIISE